MTIFTSCEKNRDLLQSYYSHLFDLISVKKVGIEKLNSNQLNDSMVKVEVCVSVDFKLNESVKHITDTQIWVLKYSETGVVQLSGFFFLNAVEYTKIDAQVKQTGNLLKVSSILEYQSDFKSDYIIAKINPRANILKSSCLIQPIDEVNGFYLCSVSQLEKFQNLSLNYELPIQNVFLHNYAWLPLLQVYPPLEQEINIKTQSEEGSLITSGILHDTKEHALWTCQKSHGLILVNGKNTYEKMYYKDIQFIFNLPNVSEEKSKIIKDACITSVALFSEIINYPYQSLTFCVVDNLEYALCQSGVLIFDRYILDNFKNGDIASYISHEIAHSWWGSNFRKLSYDLVWLYEGVADYFELIYRKLILGNLNFEKKLMEVKDMYKSPDTKQIVKGCMFMLELKSLIGEDGLLSFLHDLYTCKESVITYEKLQSIVDVHMTKRGATIDLYSFSNV